MRKLVALSGALDSLPTGWLHHSVQTVAGHRVHFAIAEAMEPDFDPQAEENREMVLVRVKGFSLNYRDKGIIFTTGRTAEGAAIGSEFVGEVIACGSQVSSLQAGQRVIAEMAWPSNGSRGTLGGVPTNAASIEFQVFHQAKLVRIPEAMPEAVAASFALGAQTVYSMVRRLNLGPDDNVLVTAASSNTSLFALQALKKSGANVHAVTTNCNTQSKLHDLNIQQVIIVKDGDFTEAIRTARSLGGFDVVIDPFADIYLPQLARTMAFFGRYVTCGVADQGYSTSTPDPCPAFAEWMTQLIVRNVKLIGNCLGLKQDLEAAIQDWEDRTFDIAIDSTYTNGQIGEFIHRTYNAADRFGKVVYLYS
jgi:NADPH:quinone reductase-like Zn-dependent oxidoreductase